VLLIVKKEMEEKTSSWFVDQYNRNRSYKEWIIAYKDIKNNLNGKESKLEMGRKNV